MNNETKAKSEDLTYRRRRLLDRCTAVLNKAESAGRDLTRAEANKFESLLAQAGDLRAGIEQPFSKP